MKEEEKDQSIISMERLHEIINEGELEHLFTNGVVEGRMIGDSYHQGSYTCWVLEYRSGYRCSLYTSNQETP